MTYDITQIVVAIIGLLGTIITVLVVPYLKQKIGSDKYNQMVQTVQIACAAAEQIFAVKYPEGGAGSAKLTYVKKYLASKGYDINSDDVLNAIEAAVQQLQQ